MNKKITVITPVYNGEEFIEKCIEQLDKQTLDNIEIIIVDDGSTDNTYELAKQYKIQNQTIKIVKANHTGVSNARNIGIANAKGEYITFVDVDDKYDNDMLETYYNAAKKGNYDIVCIEDNNNIANQCIEKYDAIKLLLNNQISMSCCNKAFKKELCKDMFDSNMRIYEDYLAFYNTLKKSKTITIVNGEKYHYIQRENSSSRARTFNEKYFDAIKVVDYSYEDIVNHYPELIESAKKRKYSTYLRIVKIYYMRKDKETSTTCEEEIKKLCKELRKIKLKEASSIFDKKTEFIRFVVLKTNIVLFSLLVKTIDKK